MRASISLGHNEMSWRKGNSVSAINTMKLEFSLSDYGKLRKKLTSNDGKLRKKLTSNDGELRKKL